MSSLLDPSRSSREPSAQSSARGASLAPPPASAGAGSSQSGSAPPAGCSSPPGSAAPGHPLEPDAGRASLPPSPSGSAQAASGADWPEQRPLGGRLPAYVPTRWREGAAVCARWPPASGPLRHGHVAAARADGTVDVLWTSGRRTKGLPAVLLEHWDEAMGDEFQQAAEEAERGEQEWAERELESMERAAERAAAQEEVARREAEVAAREGDLVRWARHWGLAPVQQLPADPGWRPRLVRFYEHYNPAQLVMVDDMLRAAQGDEENLMRALVHMYGPEPPPPQPRDAAPQSLLQRLERFYAWHSAPQSPAALARIAAEYAGRGDELLAALAAKYGPEPSPELAAAVAGHSSPGPPRQGVARAPGPAEAVFSDMQREHELVRRSQRAAAVRALAARSRDGVMRRYYYHWLEHLWWSRSHAVASRIVDEGRTGILRERYVRQQLLDQVSVLQEQLHAHEQQQLCAVEAWPAQQCSSAGWADEAPPSALSPPAPSTAPFLPQQCRAPSTAPFHPYCRSPPAGPCDAPPRRSPQILPEGAAAAAAAAHSAFRRPGPAPAACGAGEHCQPWPPAGPEAQPLPQPPYLAAACWPPSQTSDFSTDAPTVSQMENLAPEQLVLEARPHWQRRDIITPQHYQEPPPAVARQCSSVSQSAAKPDPSVEPAPAAAAPDAAQPQPARPAERSASSPSLAQHASSSASLAQHVSSSASLVQHGPAEASPAAPVKTARQPRQRKEVHVHHYYPPAEQPQAAHSGDGAPQRPRSPRHHRRHKHHRPRRRGPAQPYGEEVIEGALLRRLVSEVCALRDQALAAGWGL